MINENYILLRYITFHLLPRKKGIILLIKEEVKTRRTNYSTNNKIKI